MKNGTIQNSKLQLANNTIAVVIIDEKVFAKKETAMNYCSVMYDMDETDFLEFVKSMDNIPTYATARTLLGVIERRMVTMLEIDELVANASDWFLN